jgi:CHAT domain-containing protein
VRGVREGGWLPLKGAADEAEVVRGRLARSKYGPVTVYPGDDALEEVFKAQRAPRILHLATHGFFYPEPAEQERRPLRPIVGVLDLERRLKRLDDPLLRSGFVLAGANVLVPPNLRGKVQDGWVTAAEVALLDLQGTELVVLSACETGLGDLRIGEGVSGLRRAFQYAGARTLITSLFSVPDGQTRELMDRLYTALNAGKGKLDALHDAQLAVIEQRRKEGAAHPFFWAGFVLVGSSD